MRRKTPGLFRVPPMAALPYPIEWIEQALTPLLLPPRQARIDAVVAARIGSVCVVLDSIIDPHNAAAILRTADALGVGEVHLVETEIEALITQRITRGCERWMDLSVHPRPEACVASLRARGFALYVADAQGTRSLDQVAAQPRVALVFGNEHTGVGDALRDAADGTFAIPMRGMVESYNVSVAAGITLHAVARDRPGDLAEPARRALRARFLMESVRNPDLVIERWRRDTEARP